MSKKQTKIIVIAILCVLVVLYILYYILGIGITFFYHNDPDKIDKVLLMSGSNGKSVTITEHDDIALITEHLGELRFSRRFPPDRDGRGYSYAIYYGDKVLNIVFSGHTSINGSEYKITRTWNDREEELFNQFISKYPQNE